MELTYKRANNSAREFSLQNYKVSNFILKHPNCYNIEWNLHVLKEYT